MRSRDLRGRVIAVTGAARGIGAATADALARAGARLALADIDAPALARQQERLTAVGLAAIAVPADVTRMESWLHLRDETLRAFGRVEVLVNCAGVICPGPIDRASEREVRRQIETNFLGTVLGTQAFLPQFRAQGRGHLVHVASLGGTVPLPQEAVYSATKFAVRGFCLALALELRGTEVAVSVICPDSVDTAQLRAEALRAGSPLSFTSPPLEPREVARAIVRTIRSPRLEVAVPGWRGPLAKLLAFSPGILARVYPVLDRQGRRRREQFRAGLEHA